MIRVVLGVCVAPGRLLRDVQARRPVARSVVAGRPAVCANRVQIAAAVAEIRERPALRGGLCPVGAADALSECDCVRHSAGALLSTRGGLLWRRRLRVLARSRRRAARARASV